jgi:hypothetical protein
MQDEVVCVNIGLPISNGGWVGQQAQNNDCCDKSMEDKEPDSGGLIKSVSVSIL